MSDEWARLSFMRFRPAQVEQITGQSPDLQRKRIERFFDFPDAFWHTGGTHRRYTWVGVQMIAVFGDVLSDLGSASIATAALLRESPPHLTRSDVFEADFRDRPNGDLYLLRWFGSEDHQYFTTTNLADARRLFGDHWFGRAYIYNLSGMQRRLVANALPMLQAPPAAA